MRMKIQFIMHVAAKNERQLLMTTRAKHTTDEELEPCIIDKIEDMLDKKLFSINRIQASENQNQNRHQNSSDEILLGTFKSAMDLNQGTIGKLLQSKDNENNSIIQHFKDT